MPIEYEMKSLYNIVVEAISGYSEDLMNTYWFLNIEKSVLRSVMDKDGLCLDYFNPEQISAMRDLIRRGYWVVWDDKLGKPVLSKTPIENLYKFDDTKPTPNGAD